MNFLRDILDFLKSLINWWFIVEPWEQAVRVRFGKHVRLFGAGVHWKIPFFDILYVQNIRRRVLSLGLQTMSTSDGVVITLNGSVGYRIADVLMLHQTLHDAEPSILQEILGVVSRYTANHSSKKCLPKDITAAVTESLHLEKYGLADVDFFLSCYLSDVPAIRLIQDGAGGYSGGGSLSTRDLMPDTPVVGRYPR